MSPDPGHQWHLGRPQHHPCYASGVIGTETRVRAGLAPSGIANLPDGIARSSPDEPVGVTTGVFDASGLTDAVVVDRGTDRISILKGTPGGGLADPSPATTYQTGLDPTQVVAADLNGDGRLDLVVLNEGSQDISVFLNDGKGGFVALPRIDAGDHPTGIAAYDRNGDGLPELFVSNPNGDLLVLVGKGDGTFQPYQRAGDSVSLAVGDLSRHRPAGRCLEQRGERPAHRQLGGASRQGRNDGLKAPGPVAIADLNGDGMPDLIVTNRGGNDVLVFLGLGGEKFAPPRRFFTGTAPQGLTIANLTQQRRPARPGRDQLGLERRDHPPRGERPGRLDDGARAAIESRQIGPCQPRSPTSTATGSRTSFA